MFSAILIVLFFIVMAILVNPHIRARKVRTGAASDVELGVSLNRNQIIGRSICDPIDQKFFDE
ncbi:TPA: hypothetical protein ACMDTM_003384 [Vibrio cholerae]|uniref:hypothetical protein n=1 Tax=Vibrio anguillarum TaxID=55601 RepID=UPI0002EBF137|nr:hypothetical protein [Vibrio anguillarum]